MRRIALSLTTLLVALALPGVAGATAPPELEARLSSCRTGLDVEQRVAEFTGAMPAVAGAPAMAMRFTLEQRRGSSWKAVALEGFSRWERAESGAAGFVYDKRVERLVAGASYRVAVRFRWSAADGTVRKSAIRRSAACRQPDRRPDLAVAAITVAESSGDGRARYVVQVRNDGASAATGLADVALAVDGVALVGQALRGPSAGARASVVFDGPLCAPGGTLRAVVDPSDAVAETDEDDNALVVAVRRPESRERTSSRVACGYHGQCYEN